MEKENKEPKTLDDLKEELGELTPEEQSILNDPSLNQPLTEEELEALGPDFGERIAKRLEKEIM